jgi:hypothetical protein
MKYAFLAVQVLQAQTDLDEDLPDEVIVKQIGGILLGCLLVCRVEGLLLGDICLEIASRAELKYDVD